MFREPESNAITGNAKTKPGSALSSPPHKSILNKKWMESQLLLRKPFHTISVFTINCRANLNVLVSTLYSFDCYHITILIFPFCKHAGKEATTIPWPTVLLPFLIFIFAAEKQTTHFKVSYPRWKLKLSITPVLVIVLDWSFSIISTRRIGTF